MSACRNARRFNGLRVVRPGWLAHPNFGAGSQSLSANGVSVDAAGNVFAVGSMSAASATVPFGNGTSLSGIGAMDLLVIAAPSLVRSGACRSCSMASQCRAMCCFRCVLFDCCVLVFHSFPPACVFPPSL